MSEPPARQSSVGVVISVWVARLLKVIHALPLRAGMQGMQPMDMQQVLQMQQMMMQQMPYVVPQGFGMPAGGEAGDAC